MNIINIFPYFNEKELLELRIKLLSNYIDKFIICDANRTHSGKLKEFTAKQTLKNLNLLSDKIQIIEVDLSDYDNDKFSNRKREHIQRDSASKYINENDICIINDCDEIMNPDFIEYYSSIIKNNPNNILKIPMTFLHRYADFEIYDENNNPKIWTASFGCLKSHLEKYTLSKIREEIKLNTSHGINNIFPFIYAVDNNKIENAGWHFNWMGSTDNLITKRNSCSYSNIILIISNMNSEEEIDNHIKYYKPYENGNDILNRKNYILKKYNTDLLPKIIFNLEHIKKILLPDYIDFGENWFNYQDLYLDMINQFPSGSRFVEVGSWKGRSTFFMCENIIKSKKDIEFFCIDTWEGSEEHIGICDLTSLYETFLSNMKSVESYYFPLKLDSISASKKFKDNSLDFVFIDAAHDYESVKNDLLAWIPKIKKGGILAGHDYYPNNIGLFGVYQAVNDVFSAEQINQYGDCFIIYS